MKEEMIRGLIELSRYLISKEDSANLTNEEYKDLLEVLRFHEKRYYIDNAPLISDAEYDFLFKLAEKTETDRPDWKDPQSPTQRVGSDRTETAGSVVHQTPMLSLANSYNADDLADFDRQVKKLLGENEQIAYTVEPKYDGGGIVVVYENNYLSSGATRGDGLIGEDITANIRTLKTVPLFANFSGGGIRKVELRGEGIIRKDRFAEINQSREEEGEDIFANPRNAATGGLRMKNPADTAKRGIETFFYQISYLEGGSEVFPELDSHFERIEFLRQIGFRVPVEGVRRCHNIREVIEFCREWEEKREEYEYEIDGMVIKVDSIRQQDRMGATQHHPRWAIAFKFKAKQATSILEEVQYQVGKTGTVTPVAKITPTQLAGVTIASVSLHNEDFIKSKDIRIGDHILIERAGDVIPYIVKTFPELRDGSEIPIRFPQYCPVCHTPLVREEGEAAWRCPNINCAAQVLQRIIYHVSKDAMDIDGIGKALVERFYNLGWIRNISDIYDLDYSKIEKLEGFGKKSAENLKVSIEKAKNNSLSRILTSLSIHHVGRKVSSIVAAHIEYLFDLMTWKEEDYIKIPDIGPVVAQNLMDFFSVEKNIEILRRMESLGVNMHQKESDRPLEIKSDSPFAGKKILFTGTLETMTRNEAQKIATDNGATLLSAVSKNLDILVTGANAGSKLKKARELGTVAIIDETTFRSMISSE